MSKTRCFLCGGRVSRGVCAQCGMPQRQRAENYHLNTSECDDQPLTHVHEEKASHSGRRGKSVVAVIVMAAVIVVMAVSVVGMVRDNFGSVNETMVDGQPEADTQ